MIAETKIRINLLAKDLEMKSKDLTDGIAAAGLGTKNSTGTLNADEFSVLLDYLTLQNQISNMGDYLSGKADVKHKEPKVHKVKAEEKPAEPEKAPEKAEQKKPEPKNEAPKKSEEKPAQKKQTVKIPSQPQPERGASKTLDRFAKPNFGSQQSKPQQKPEKKQEQPQKNANIKMGGGETVTAVKKTRVVDTRSSNVDLSKYDERLESFVPDSARRANVPDRQKLKKQPNKAFPTRKDQDKAGKGKKESTPPKKQKLVISVPDEITVGELAQRLKVTASEVVKRLMMMGVMATVNQEIDYDTAYLIADELGAVVNKEVHVSIEEKLFDVAEDAPETLVERPPVICVMGHVDHGKTSLLDAIRNTHVTAGEAGGITQSIGAYRVNINGKYITFLDTPGHEAFTAMRARGAMATDIAILVVAADDGIMPQTVEAINHAKAAGVEIIVAINKIDKPGANPDQVKQELTQYDLLPEEWGGKTICVPVSALTKKGIPDLLENILLVAEVAELKANPKRRAKGVVIEAKLDKGRGPVATILVQNGTLRAGDTVIAGTSVGRVRAMTDDRGKPVKEAGPSVPVEIAGLDEVPMAGDEFNAVEDEKMARELAEQRRMKEKEDELNANTRIKLEDFFNQIKEGVKDLNIVVKADVKGSAEAVKTSLLKPSNDEVHVNVIHSAVGGITENDVQFAAASSAIIVGFNVRPDKTAIDSADRQGVEIRTYRIIYECIEEIEAAIKGMLKPVFREAVLGHAEVRQTIHVPNVGTIAGSYVQDGKITNKSKIRIVRDGVVIFEDAISSLRRFKDDVKEVASGYECGVGLEKFNDIKVGDILEAFIMEQVER
ncbi:MAG: translation initiation factor IF-2 [Clostridia bacterium]|nr:translation initiation factor IF-2 [Clostridia bacterium]